MGMSYVALLVIFGDNTGHLADWIKTYEYNRFYANKKSGLPRRGTAFSRIVAACGEPREDRIDASGDENENASGGRRSAMTLIILLLGLAVGVLVGLLGIGGGVVLVPAMVYLLHMDQHAAQGTSLLILLPPVGLGALREYWKQGQVDLRAGLLCALGMLVGGCVGGLIAVPLASRHLKGLFGCFLILAAFLLWRNPPAQNPLAGPVGEETARG
jgi:MFS family permease